jgi:cytochrome c553
MTLTRGRESDPAAPAETACVALAVAGALLWSVANPSSASDARAGRTKARACVACHGESGISVQPDAPNLAGQPAIYLAEQLRQFRSGKRPSEVMAVIGKPLSDAEIDDLAAWYASIEIQTEPAR